MRGSKKKNSLVMALQELGKEFCIFSPQSITLITATSNSGKSHFISEVLQNKEWFFSTDQIQRIVYINGNINSVHNPPDLDNLILLSFDDLEHHENLLEEKDCVIIDDLLYLTPGVIKLLKYSTHHQNLTCFVLTQSILGDKLFSLTRLVHNLILLFNTSAATRIVLEILPKYFISNQTKTYLKTIVAEAERNKSILLLKLNSVASFTSKILCYSQLERLVSDFYCLAYPDLQHMDEFQRKGIDLTNVPGDQLVIVPARYVIQQKNIEGKCTAEEKWSELVKSLNEDIENVFKFSKWTHCKSLAREILKNEDICISSDYRLILIKNKPRFQVPFIDFLAIATRKHAPTENATKYYYLAPLMTVLKQNNLPESLIHNKLLLALNTSSFRTKAYSTKLKGKNGRRGQYLQYSIDKTRYSQ